MSATTRYPVSSTEQAARAAADQAILALNPAALATLDAETRQDALAVAISAVDSMRRMLVRMRTAEVAQAEALRALVVAAQLDAAARTPQT